MTLTARAMKQADIPACLAIINPIIAEGTTTAHEDPFTLDNFEYFTDPATANVVEQDGCIVGFQSAFTVEPGVYSVGTFTDRAHPVPGAGRALTDKTKADCRVLGGHSILAKITSDNTGALAFYSKMGFQDETVLAGDHTRKDGTVVDRVIKRFTL